MGIQERVNRLEKQAGSASPEEGARDYVEVLDEVGLLPEDMDFEEAVAYCVEAGITLKSVLEEIGKGPRHKPNPKAADPSWSAEKEQQA